ncbi:ATP-binding protein [Epilithonimonas hungarica]|uniref:ATPase family associated with various cellular activities (AAA) n=1 Tax=Epilithonimonas hungarica TaxID=454006 RepID=A0A1G7JJ03_9FLAO|nr:ATP-binding protein [Epilithonimonas hungarica]SDF24469.1 ATPase family associated with various cellular activities (AAA) [Epilithonimonas hungarica]
MIQNITEFSKKLDVSEESIKQFIQDFDLEISDCLSPNLNITQNFERFAIENQEFLKKYDEDLNKEKTADDISKRIHQPKEKIEQIIQDQFPNIYDNGIYKSSISTFGIDNQLGGNYQFIYNYFGDKTELKQRDFIGYRDLFFYISDMLEPFLNPEQSENWGIQKAAGIIVYGPPGSGKIFWAKKIAEMIDFDFFEIRKSQLKSILVNDKKTSFDEYLSQILKKDNVILFLENFDEIMMQRQEKQIINSDHEDVKESTLHNIEKFEKENIVMIGSAKELIGIEPEILAPGRFDVLIPVFPPNKQERAEMLLFNMTKNLNENATLLKILKNNKADQIPFWKEPAEKMKVFSNTMLIDFTQSLKKRIRSLYLKNRTENIQIGQGVLDACLKESASKLTGEYLNSVQQFLSEAEDNSYDRFAARIEDLKQELENYKAKDEPIRTIGFHINEE